MSDRIPSGTRGVGFKLSLLAMLLVGSDWALAEKSLNDLTGPWQLFVDDHLIAARKNVVRTYHPFVKHPGNPVLRPEEPWEGTNVYLYGSVLPAESGQGYRMWYHALPGDHDYYRLLYATSEDGIRWHKPGLGLVEYNGSTDNNIFIRRGKRDHILTVIHTPWETDPARRYKMINYDGVAGGYLAACSHDGLRWTDASSEPVFTDAGDVGQFLWDFHTGGYVGYVKNIFDVSGMRRRCVSRIASGDITSWPAPELVLAPDSHDDRWAEGIQRTHFYGLSAFAYESMYLGFLWVFRATDSEGYFDGIIFIELVTSRDGVHWRRQEGERPPVLPVGAPDTWDDGMIFTVQHPLVEGDELRLYYGGFDCTHAARPPWNGAIGLATLRKDGFASLDARTETGTVTTKRLAGVGGQLIVNYRATGGSLQVEVLDEKGDVVPGYGRKECGALAGDSTRQLVTWGEGKELPAGGGPVRLRFVMTDASVYSFMAGESVSALEDPAPPVFGVVYTFENDHGRRVSDAWTGDGEQTPRIHGNLKVDDKGDNAAFGERAMPIGSKYSPWSTLEIEQTRELGLSFTLAIMAQSQDNRHARLFSSYDDSGPIKTSDLIFDCDPKGQAIPGLRLICKGIEVLSNPVSFADGKYHHLAVVYDDGRITFYLDGKDVGGGRVPGGDPVSMERNLFVGEDSQHGWDQQLRGYVDDIVVLGRALGPEEIETLAVKGAASLNR